MEECLTPKCEDETSSINANPNISDFVTLSPPEEVTQPVGVLDEDHPLLKRFQDALRAHLLKVQAQLTNDISEINHKIKEKEKQREECGSRLYDMQQEICHQNGMIEEYEMKINEMAERRIEQEKSLSSLKQDYEDKLKMDKERKRLFNEKVHELQNLQALENNIHKWSKEIDDEVSSAKRAAKKESVNQKSISEEKKKMDMLCFHLEAEVRKREVELKGINSQIQEHENSLELFRKSLSDANADLDALQYEHKRLSQAWGEVITGIQHRDKILHQGKRELQAEQEKYRNVCNNIEAVKKEHTKQMKEKTKIKKFMKHITDSLESVKKQLQGENDRFEGHLATLQQLEILAQKSTEDYNLAKQEENNINIKYRVILAQVDKLNSRKIQIEDEIMKLAQEEIQTDKASEYRMRIMKEKQHSRRILEINLSQLDNNISTTLLEIEKIKGILIKLKERKEELTEQYETYHKKEEKILHETRVIDKDIDLKTKKCGILNKKYEELLRQTGGALTIDRKIKDIQTDISELEEKTKSLRKFWLSLQTRLVQITNRRNTQYGNLQIARRHVMLMSQKNLNVSVDLDRVKKEGSELSKSISKLEAQLDVLGPKLHKKMSSLESDEYSCNVRHTEILSKLKDCEINIHQTEIETYEILNEIKSLKEQVLQKQREALSWETKYKMTDEIIRWKNNEKNVEDIKNMKMEIHRMEIRLNQLKRAQEKLTQDLEFCVLHREKIFYNALMKEKLFSDNSPHAIQKTNNTNNNIQFKLNEMKNKMKVINNEIKQNEKSLIEFEESLKQIENECNKIEKDLNDEKEQDNLIQNEIEMGILMKYKNLENIIRKQNRVKRYCSISNVSNKVLPKIRPEPSLDREICKQMEANENLINVIMELIAKCTEKKLCLSRILQTLKDEE